MVPVIVSFSIIVGICRWNVRVDFLNTFIRSNQEHAVAKNYRPSGRNPEPAALRFRCSALTNWAIQRDDCACRSLTTSSCINTKVIPMYGVLLLVQLGPVYMRPGRSQTWNENWNCQHVYIRPVRKSQNFQFTVPLDRGNFLFQMAFVCMCCSNVKVTAETGLICICVYNHPSWIHAGLKSQSARSSRRNDLRPV